MSGEWSDEWPTVATYQNEVEAEMAQGALGAEGIEAIVWKDDAGGMYPQFQPVYGVALRVAPEDFERARAIVSALAQSGTEPEEREAGEPPAESDGPGEGGPEGEASERPGADRGE
jgi:hypothetical protein